MRNLYSVLLIMGALSAFVLFTGNSSGPAGNNNYFTGAPSTGSGTENTCRVCHSSGATTFGEPLVEWTISETMGGPGVSSYLPGQTYFVTVAVSAPDATSAPAAFGFSSVFLDDTEAPMGGSAQLAGTFSGFDANTQASNGNNGRLYIEHNGRNPSGVWNFSWTAPAAGFGDVKIYSVGNAVNSNFSTSGDSGSSASTVITLQEDNTLPLTLDNFSASAEKSTVTLNWLTSNEENTSHFEIERSTDGQRFSFLDEIRAKGSIGLVSEYSIVDRQAPAGQQFYRLKMVDLDGSFTYSSVVTVDIETEVLVNVYPNPTADRITITPQNNELTGVRLLDGTGRVLRPAMQAGEHDLSMLRPGIYLLEITTNGTRTVKQIVKQ